MSSLISITWSSLFVDLKDELNETSPGEVLLIRIANRIAREMNAELDLESCINTAPLYFCGENAIKYAEPTGMKSDGLIEIRPANSYVDWPIRLISPLRFAKYSSGEFVTIEKDAGVEYFKILHDQFDGQSVLFAPCETSLTAEGAWTAGTGCTNITHDTADYRFGNGAINFDTDGDGSKTALISFIKSSTIDISGFTNQQRVRFWMKLPTAPSSIAVRWGLDSSHYYSHSLTTQVGGGAFNTTEWNELEAVQASATATGTMHSQATATISIANPCVITSASHGLGDGTAVYFTTTGALPTGISANAIYYTYSTGGNTFNLYDSYANAIAGGTTGRVITTGSQSGIHTAIANADKSTIYFALVITFAAGNTDTDYLIDEIRMIKPEEMQVEYYSVNVARTTASVYSEGLTELASTTDLFTFYNEFRETLINGACSRYLKMRGTDPKKNDAEIYRQLYEKNKIGIKTKYPSRRAVPQRKRTLPRLSY
jgi:hypothetical protein